MFTNHATRNSPVRGPRNVRRKRVEISAKSPRRSKRLKCASSRFVATGNKNWGQEYLQKGRWGSSRRLKYTSLQTSRYRARQSYTPSPPPMYAIVHELIGNSFLFFFAITINVSKMFYSESKDQFLTNSNNYKKKTH